MLKSNKNDTTQRESIKLIGFSRKKKENWNLYTIAYNTTLFIWVDLIFMPKERKAGSIQIYFDTDSAY